MEKTPGKVNIVFAKTPEGSSGENSLEFQPDIVKKPKSKRGLVSELEQENLPANSQAFNLSGVNVTSTSSNRPLVISQTNDSTFIPRSPLRPRQSPLRPNLDRANSSLLERRLILSPKRRLLTPLSPQRRLLSSSSPQRRLISSSSPQVELANNAEATLMKPKKRWQMEVFQEQQSNVKGNKEVLARPIEWNDEDEVKRRSPKSWIVAKALVELSELSSNRRVNEEVSTNSEQPLNLSLNSGS